MHAFIELLFWLVVGHAAADWSGLQGEFLSQAKNRNTPVGEKMWKWALPFHSIIHGGAVAFVTGSVGLGMAETIIHIATDYAKCEDWIDLDTDQTIHLLCKVLWAAIVVWSV